MPTNTVEIDLDLREAMRRVGDLPDDTREGARQAVRQLAVLAESYYKTEAPEGAGDEVHMRDTVTTEFSRQGRRARVFARKRIGDGTRLVTRVTGRNEPAWSWDDPPPIPALMPWAAAKTGDPGFAYYLQHKLVEDGYDTDPFVDRAFREYNSQVAVESQTARQLRDALGGV